jgi:O-antigen/teichoic acid export membrane protein
MSLKKQAISGMIWTYSQQFGGQLVTFAVSIVLSRILMPEEFGLIGMLTIFIGIGTALFDGGMTSSIIRSKNLRQSDYSTVFFFNLLCSTLLYIILFISAPFIASFYRQTELTAITRVYGVTFIVSAFGSVQNTILTRNLNFKKQAIITFISLFVSGIVGVFLAYLGFGVWSLVWSAIVNALLLTIILWSTSAWYPKFIFSIKKFHRHFHYGYKLTLSSILDIFFTNIYQIIIGRFYSPSQVGFYTRANSLMMLPVGNISGALNRVVFPVFSKIQDDIPRLKIAYKKIMQMVIFIVAPILVLMIVLAKPIVVFLFTDKWLNMVPILQILCLSGLLYPIHLYNLVVLQVKGRSDLFLKLELFKKLVTIITLTISMFFGFYGLLWGQLISSIIALFINTHYAGKMLYYSVFSQIRDLAPIFLYSLLMAIAVFLINRVLEEYAFLLQLILSSFVGFLVYLTCAWLFKFESINDIKNLILKNDTSY